MEKKERIGVFDVAKGILIIVVVLGHVMPENNIIHAWIYGWHIPTFFLINGMLLKHVGYADRSFIKKNGALINGIIKLIIPYFVYGGILLFARWASIGFDLDNLIWQTKDLIMFCGIGATWFLPCLFITQIIYYISKKVLIKTIGSHRLFMELLFLFIGAICYLSVLLLPNLNFITLILYRALIAYFFCILGDLSLNIFIKISRLKYSLIILLTSVSLILSIAMFILTGKNQAALNVLNIGSPVAYVINAILGSAFILLFSILIDRFNAKFIRRMLMFFGKHSLEIMGTHQVVMIILFIPIVNNYFLNLCLCAAVIAAEVPVVLIIDKIKLFFGKCHGKRSEKNTIKVS